jgi:hypothetical protein
MNKANFGSTKRRKLCRHLYRAAFFFGVCLAFADIGKLLAITGTHFPLVLPTHSCEPQRRVMDHRMCWIIVGITEVEEG